jgi:hypothetical protein
MDMHLEERIEVCEGVSIDFVSRGEGPHIRKHAVALIDYTCVLAHVQEKLEVERRSCFTCVVGTAAIISGLDKALVRLREGDEASVYVCAAEAYGAESGPNMPPHSDLCFHVHVRSVTNVPGSMAELIEVVARRSVVIEAFMAQSTQRRGVITIERVRKACYVWRMALSRVCTTSDVRDGARRRNLCRVPRACWMCAGPENSVPSDVGGSLC